uniref:Uncharacterized protein n=1 Tax=Anguilla anguilla TaxID=7936 RepID=A0A0E9WAE3_ANGAN
MSYFPGCYDFKTRLAVFLDVMMSQNAASFFPVCDNGQWKCFLSGCKGITKNSTIN